MKRSRLPEKTLRADAASMIETCAGWNSRLAARRITQFLDRALSETGMTSAQIGLMAQIAAASDDALSTLAKRGGFEQSTYSRNLRQLELEGLVEIGAVKGDLRRRAVWLTETGARKLEAAMPVWRNAHAALAKRFDTHLAARLAAASETLSED